MLVCPRTRAAASRPSPRATTVAPVWRYQRGVIPRPSRSASLTNSRKVRRRLCSVRTHRSVEAPSRGGRRAGQREVYPCAPPPARPCDRTPTERPCSKHDPILPVGWRHLALARSSQWSARGVPRSTRRPEARHFVVAPPALGQWVMCWVVNEAWHALGTAGDRRSLHRRPEFPDLERDGQRQYEPP